MLDPADCGPATIAISQDVQGESFDYPEAFLKNAFMRLEEFILILIKLKLQLKN